MRLSFVDSAGALAPVPMLEPREPALHAPVAGPAANARPAAELPPLDGIMDRYARGDDAAFDELYRHGSPRLRGFLLRLCGHAALADDLVQEAFLRIHRARGSFAQGAAALPWMLAIARNAFLDQVRRTRARPQGSFQSEDELDRREAPPSGRGDEALAAREALDLVRRTLAELPMLQREAFILIRFEGLSVAEAAEVLGATEGAVKIRAFRAYEALRAALKESEDRDTNREPADARGPQASRRAAR